MKKPMLFIAGIITGAILLYLFLWVQVFLEADKAWCKIYIGEKSVERIEHCNRILE